MQVLCSSLTYNQGMPHMLKGEPISRGICLYQPPFEEFQLLRMTVDKPGVTNVPAQESPMILLGLECAGMHSLQSCACAVQDPALESLVKVQRGTVLFIPAGTPLELHSLPDNSGIVCKLLAYAVTANDNMMISALEAARRMHRSMSMGTIWKSKVTVREDCAWMGSSCNVRKVARAAQCAASSPGLQLSNGSSQRAGEEQCVASRESCPRTRSVDH
jgi:hypothetical protein